MIRTSLALSTTIAGWLVGHAPAQLPLTLSDGNVAYTVTSVPTSPASASGFADFTANAPVDPDVLLQHVWLYRIAGDARESALNDGNGQPFQAALVTPDVAVLRWDDVDNRGQLAATWTLQAVRTGAQSGMTISRMTVRNIGQAPVSLELFAYADIDLCTFATNAAHAGPSARPGTRQRITNPVFCRSDGVEFFGAHADRFEVDQFPLLRNRLLDAAVHDLSDTGLPFAPADYTGAAQWRVDALAAGRSHSVVAILGHNHSACEDPARSETYGQGSPGPLGVAAIAAETEAVTGSAHRMTVVNTASNAVGLVIWGVQRTSTSIPPVVLYTNWIPMMGAFHIAFDATGRGSLGCPIPPRLDLCGAVVQFQCLYVDLLSVPIGFGYTNALELTLGGY